MDSEKAPSINNGRTYLKIAIIAFSCSILSGILRIFMSDRTVLATALGIILGGIVSYFIPPRMEISFVKWLITCVIISVTFYILSVSL
jgi:hypothetical protein